MTRIHQPLTDAHLEVIKEEALKELNRFYTEVGAPGKYSVYKNKLIGIFLCQGAVQHYVNASLPKSEVYDKEVFLSEEDVLELEDKAAGVKFDNEGNVLSGIQDIDVWFLFHKDPEVSIPDIRNCKAEGQVFLEGIGAIKVDFMKKAISKKISDSVVGKDIPTVVKAYLSNADTDTSYYLAQKSIIGLYPDTMFSLPIYKCRRRLESFKES